MRLGRLAPETRKQVGHDDKLVPGLVPQLRAGPAALEEQRSSLVVPRRETNGAVAVPELQRIGLVLGLVVRRRVQLEDDVAGRDDQRPGIAERLLELEPPLIGAFRDEGRQGCEPVRLAGPVLDEG